MHLELTFFFIKKLSLGKIHFHNSAMAYIRLVSSFRHGLIITVSLVASQIKGSEMSKKRLIERLKNLKINSIKIS